jgi:hypothetical protein
MKRTPKKLTRKQHTKRSKRSLKKGSYKNRSRKNKSDRKNKKKSHITYNSRSKKFFLSQRISRHQCSSFLGNTLHPNLTQFITPSCSMCTDNST